MTHRDRARAAVAALPRLDFAMIKELRLVLSAPKDGSIDADLHADLERIAGGVDAVVRALERIRLRAAGQRT